MISMRPINSQKEIEDLADHLLGSSKSSQSHQSLSGPIELNVPFKEKDEAKKLGALWNPERKKWFIPAGMEAKPFEQWFEKAPMISGSPSNPTVTQTLHAPIWLLSSTESCYRCHKESAVFAITSQVVVDFEEDDDGDVYYETYESDQSTYLSISNLEYVDAKLAQHLSKEAPNYRIDFSKTQGDHCYMNHCQHCGAKLGDFFMHNEPGGAFFPETYDDVLKMRRMMIEEGEHSIYGSIGHVGW